MDRTGRFMVWRVLAIVAFWSLSSHLVAAQAGADPQTRGEVNWAAQILMKIRGDVRWDAEGFFTQWPDSVDMAVAVASAPTIEDNKLPDGPVAVGWLLPLAPATGLEPTKTRVRLSPSDEMKGAWEFKSAVLTMQKDAKVSRYPVDVVFEIAETGPGYRLELHGFKSGGPAFQARGTPTLFA